MMLPWVPTIRDHQWDVSKTPVCYARPTSSLMVYKIQENPVFLRIVIQIYKKILDSLESKEKNYK